MYEYSPKPQTTYKEGLEAEVESLPEPEPVAIPTEENDGPSTQERAEASEQERLANLRMVRDELGMKEVLKQESDINRERDDQTRQELNKLSGQVEGVVTVFTKTEISRQPFEFEELQVANPDEFDKDRVARGLDSFGQYLDNVEVPSSQEGNIGQFLQDPESFDRIVLGMEETHTTLTRLQQSVKESEDPKDRLIGENAFLVGKKMAEKIEDFQHKQRIIHEYLAS